MRQMLLLFTIVALLTAVVAAVASAQSWPASYQSAQTCTSGCLPSSCAPASGQAVAPGVSGCVVQSGYCRVTGAQRWGADLASAPLSGPLPAGYVMNAAGPNGRADFQLTKEGDALRFWLNVANIGCVTEAEIRLLQPGGDAAKAPVVATLYDGPEHSGAFSGRLARGNITSADLSGPLQGHPIGDLLQAMTSGRAIVVVNTELHPQGEIAGIPSCNLA